MRRGGEKLVLFAARAAQSCSGLCPFPVACSALCPFPVVCVAQPADTKAQECEEGIQDRSREA